MVLFLRCVVLEQFLTVDRNTDWRRDRQLDFVASNPADPNGNAKRRKDNFFRCDGAGEQA
jgi:hypothetical protein